MIPKSEVYNAYKRFCASKNVSPDSEQFFSRRMTKDHGFEYKQSTINKERVRDYFWIDLTLKEPYYSR